MEVALLRKVNEKRHSGIVEVLEWFECADCFLVVMARPTPVMDLFDYVSKRKRLNELEARYMYNYSLNNFKNFWAIPFINFWLKPIYEFLVFLRDDDPCILKVI